MFFGQFVYCRNVFGACVYAVIVLAGLTVSAGSLHARSRSDAMLIIDSSISMTGKIGGKSKISLVRKALRPAFKSARPRLNLGVIFYGHRRRGDCKDVQHVIRLGDIRQKRYMEIINGIDPKGRAPASRAINLAADILKKRGQSNSVVLITDGFDICKGKDNDNLCTLGKQLQRKNSGLKVHVIALRSKTSKMASLRCLAKRTGGKYTAVNTSGSIAQAIEDTFKLASSGNIPIPRADPRRAVQTPPVLVSDQNGTGIIAEKPLEALAENRFGKKAETPEIKATPVPVSEQDTTALNRIISPKPIPLAEIPASVPPEPAQEDASEAPPEETTTSIFNSFFGPGKKTLQIINRPSSPNSAPGAADPQQIVKNIPAEQTTGASKKLPDRDATAPEIPAKPMRPQHSGLNLSARLGADGPLIESDLFWRVFEAKKTGGRQKEIRQTGAPRPLLDLKPGKYDVTVQFGTVVQRQMVRIRSGKITDTVIDLEAGVIKARAVRVAGGKLLDKDVSYTLFGNPANNTGNRTEISRKTASKTRFFVKPGRYRLMGVFGSTTLTTDISVSLGKTTMATLVFNTGILKVSAIAGKGGAVVNGATYIISRAQADADGQRREIARSSKNRTRFTLPAGFYHLKVQQGLASLERTIKIEANKTKILVLNLNAGYLKLSASPAEGAQILKGDVHYTVYKGDESLDGKREEIAQSTKSSPTFWLPAGEYFIKATYGLASDGILIKISANKRSEKTIIVNAGALSLSSRVEGLPEKLKSRVFYTIYDAKPDIEGNYREVFSTSQAEKTVRIPPGEYLIEGRWGTTNVRTPVSAVVTAGKRTSAVVIHRAGRARFKLTSVPGGAPTGKPYWSFYDLAGTEIGRNVKPMPERIFAAGKYIVMVRYDDQEFKAEFSIKSGDRKQIDIIARQ